MASSEMLHCVALVRTNVSEELSASFIRVTRIGELGTTLAVTRNRRTQNVVSLLGLLQTFVFGLHVTSMRDYSDLEILAFHVPTQVSTPNVKCHNSCNYLRGRLYSVLAGHSRVNKTVVFVAHEVSEGWSLVGQ
jgi:hypothetical protein